MRVYIANVFIGRATFIGLNLADEIDQYIAVFES